MIALRFFFADLQTHAVLMILIRIVMLIAVLPCLPPFSRRDQFPITKLIPDTLAAVQMLVLLSFLG